MKGFKDSTKTMRMNEGGACYAKGGKVAAAKVGKVMHEYGKGELHSGSKKGPVVKSQKQAVAIALSEGRKAAEGKAKGGKMTKPVAKPMAKPSMAVRPGADMAPPPPVMPGNMAAAPMMPGALSAAMPMAAAPMAAAPMGRMPMRRFGKGGLNDPNMQESTSSGPTGYTVLPTDPDYGDEGVMRIPQPSRNARGVEVTKTRLYTDPTPQAPQTPLSRRLSQKPRPKGGYDSTPLIDRAVNAVRDTLGFKKGGMSKGGYNKGGMSKGKKGC